MAFVTSTNQNGQGYIASQASPFWGRKEQQASKLPGSESSGTSPQKEKGWILTLTVLAVLLGWMMGAGTGLAQTPDSGHVLELSGYIGGDERDVVHAATATNDHEVYLVGRTSVKESFMPPGGQRGGIAPECWIEEHDDLPAAPDFSIQCGLGGPDNGFVAKYNDIGEPTGFEFIGTTDGYNAVTDIAVSDEGDAYVVGWTAGSLDDADNAYEGGRDAFLAKLDTTKLDVRAGGGTLDAGSSATEWAIHLGGSDRDEALAVIVNLSGNPVVVGETASRDFPTEINVVGEGSNESQDPNVTDPPLQQQEENDLQVGGDDFAIEEYQPSNSNRYRGGSSDAFVTIVSDDGGEIYSSYFIGGDSADVAKDVALSESSLYIVGSTVSSELKSPWGTLEGGTTSANRDAFVFDKSLIPAVKDTGRVIGSLQSDQVATAVGVVEDRGVVVAGETNGELSPSPSSTARQPNFGGGASDGFVLFESNVGDGPAPDELSYLGGGDADGITGLEVLNGAVFLGGTTQSPDFPTTSQVPDTMKAPFGGQDAFLVHLNGRTDERRYSGRIGGSGDEEGRGVAISPGGIFNLVGSTRSDDFYFRRGPSSSRGGSLDGFLTRLTPEGERPSNITVEATGPSEINMEDAPFTVDIEVRNTATTPAQNVVLASSLSQGSASSAPGACDISGSDVQCTWGEIPGGETRTAHVEVDPFGAPRMVEGTFEVRTDSREYETGEDNRATTSTEVFSRVDLEIRFVEVTQGIQDRRHSIPLIQDKTTYGRAHVRAARGTASRGDSLVSVSNVSAELRGWDGDGNELPGSPITPVATIPSTLDADTDDRNGREAIDFRLPNEWVDNQESLQLEATVNPDRSFAEERWRGNNSERTETYQLWAVSPICIRTQPVQTNSSLPDPDLENTRNGESTLTLAEALLPTPEIRIFPNSNPITPGIFEAGDTFEFDEDNDNFDSGKVLNLLWWRVRTGTPPSWCTYQGARTHWAGIVNEDNWSSGPGGVARYERTFWFVLASNSGGWNDINSPRGGNTLAHELGHNYGRDHVDCGDPDNTDQNYPFSNCQLGPTGQDDFFGYDTRDPSNAPGRGGQRGIHPNLPAVSGATGSISDLMSYANHRWPSSWTWMSLWNRFRTQHCSATSSGQNFYCEEPPPSKTAPAFGRSVSSGLQSGPGEARLATSRMSLHKEGGAAQLELHGPVGPSAPSLLPSRRAGQLGGLGTGLGSSQQHLKGEAAGEGLVDGSFATESFTEQDVPDRLVVVDGTLNIFENTSDLSAIELESQVLETEEAQRLLDTGPREADYPVSVRLRDEEGALLDSTYVQLIRTADAGPSGRRTFSAALPWSPEATSVEAFLRGEILARQSLEGPVPEVEVEAPNGGEVLEDEPFIAHWGVRGVPEPDSVEYMVHYTPDDGQTWHPLSIGLGSEELKLRPSELPGSSGSARLRVIAVLDGRSDADQSDGPFRVVGHTPDVNILSPDSSASVAAGGQAYLHGRAYDKDEGYLTGDALQWRVEGPDEELIRTGSGEKMTAFDLPSGTYTITLTATDSDGQEATATRQIRVERIEGVTPRNFDPGASSPDTSDFEQDPPDRDAPQQDTLQKDTSDLDPGDSGDLDRGTTDSTDVASNDQVSAQSSGGLSLTAIPKAGMFLSGVSSFEDVSGEVGASLGGEQSVFTWGGSLAFGSRDGLSNLRLTGLRTTGSLVSTTEGVDATSEMVRDQMFAITGDLVVRPLPRVLIRPYATGGVGARKLSVIRPDDLGTDSRWDAAAQVGLGADVPVGPGGMSLGVEVVDYLTGFPGTESGVQHDAFLFLTLGVSVF